MKLIKLQILLLLSLLSVYARGEKACLLEARKGVCLAEKVVQDCMWDGNKPLHEWKTFESKDPITDNTITWIFNEYDYSPIAKLKNGKSFSILSDHLGTPTHMYNEEGEEVWSGTLDIYGRKRSESGENGVLNFRYQGQYEDVETGLYYTRNRYFDPEIGGFLSIDPAGLKGGNPTLYGYVYNNNLEIDPFGLDTIRLRHYTSNKGLEGIKETKVIKAYDQNTVFTEKAKGKPLSAADAAEKYGIQKSSARNYIEFDVDASRVEIVENPITKAREYTVKGDIELGDDAKFFKRCK